ncbi:hypothetical protein P8629_05190 [Hydrogenovibrio sp. 3SP14C1]|uniref:hypothetical protein n=1 Tax=Hydrogenovibrio sp. 3SP14C1 TaxID=3038774 RepID=UPI002416B67B|nr:hypothetical protein [Hydrogenovibrio sp. 3SP14C1]MDG4812394.1 hypothetical protein [Hydrogenovibrio sp. 3SP14C1]
MGSQKIAKLNQVTAMLEGRSRGARKLPLDVAKARLRLRDPGLEITQTLKSLNGGDTREAMAYFLCNNFLTPFLVKLISKKESSNPHLN